MGDLGHQSTTALCRARRVCRSVGAKRPVVLVRLSGLEVVVPVRWQRHLQNSIRPRTRSVIVVVRVGIVPARGLTLSVVFWVILVGQQPATIVNKALPCSVFQMVGENLAETVVSELFVGSGGICVRWIIDAGGTMVSVASIGSYVLTFVAHTMHVMA